MERSVGYLCNNLFPLRDKDSTLDARSMWEFVERVALHIDYPPLPSVTEYRRS